MKTTKLFVLMTFAAFLLTAALPNMLLTGLDDPEPIGKYLNGKLPELSPNTNDGDWTLEEVFLLEDVNKPLHMAQEPGTTRLLVAEMEGFIVTVDKNGPDESSMFLDIRDQVHFEGESGLLNFAFHPRYGVDNRYFYVFYQYQELGDERFYTRISRFEVDEMTQVANRDSEEVLIQVYDEACNHNGGGLFFDQDGFLHISFGDEGLGDDAFNNSQLLNKGFFAGMLRIDVDQDAGKSHPIRRQPAKVDVDDKSFTDNYFIPNDNPFLDEGGGLLEEFYAIGLRNPHRVTYDELTNTIWAADVGQAQREEVNIIKKGYNYQWAFKEATLDGPKPRPGEVFGVESGPIYDYGRTMGDKSITGGYVYRGSEHPELVGKYIFGDFVSNRIWSLDYDVDTGDVQVEELMRASGTGIAAFATDADGELYVLGLFRGGIIYRLTKAGEPNPEPPTLLSQTGAFKDLNTLEPVEGLLPFEVNQPFWSDGALKRRWIAVPNDGSHDTEEEQIQFKENEPWTFPKGTVLIKHFDFNTDERDPTKTRRLETRFEVRDELGRFYYMTYRWNTAGTDAELVTTEINEDIPYIDASGTAQTLNWYYPNREDCKTCHQSASGYVLGPTTYQMNGEAFYAKTGRTANQLETFDKLGLFSTPLNKNDIEKYQKVVALDDPSASLEERARSYLEVNCSYCHRPGGSTSTGFDLRLGTPLEDQGIIDVTGKDNLGLPDAKLIAPGSPDKSLLFLRTAAADDGIAMPPLAKNKVDENGKEVLKEWIENLTAPVNDDTLKPYMYPVPATSSLNIVGAKLGHNLTILSNRGEVVMEIKENTAKSVDISPLTPGIYLLVIDGEPIRKFIKY